MDILEQDIKFLPGVGPNRKKMLSNELGIETYGDLLEYYPYKYVDRSKVYTIHELTGEMPFVQVTGRILSFESFPMGPRKERVVAHFTDGTGICDLTWFNGGKYAKQNYKIGTEYLVFGKPTVFNNRINFTHPDLDDASKIDISSMGLQPYYNTTEKMKKSGLNSRAIERLTKTLIERLPTLPETLPDFIISSRHLMGRDEAFRTVHYPQEAKSLERARVRLKFEELFYIQLNILRYASDQRRKYRGYIFPKVGEVFNSFYHNNLPFPLTEAQKRVIREIRADVGSGRQMNRLLQGDVGSGKTLVALMSMLIAIERLPSLYHGSYGNPRRTASADHHAIPQGNGYPCGPAHRYRQGKTSGRSTRGIARWYGTDSRRHPRRYRRYGAVCPPRLCCSR